MNPGPQIARWRAAMILAIIAWAAPPSAGAHEGHAHPGPHRAAIRTLAAEIVAAEIVAAQDVEIAPMRAFLKRRVGQ